MKDALHELLLKRPPAAAWDEICALFVYDDDVASYRTYHRTANGPWRCYDYEGFALLDWFEAQFGADSQLRSIKATLDKSGHFQLKRGHEPRDFLMQGDDNALINSF